MGREGGPCHEIFVATDAGELHAGMRVGGDLTEEIDRKRSVERDQSTITRDQAWLVDLIDGQEAVRFLPVALVNDPARIARNRNMVTINGALSIDLAGQIVADTLDGAQYSGIGGHEDFIAGGTLEADDRSLVCLPSTVEAAGGIRSRIVAELAAGAIVTTPRHQLDVVVTEFGVAHVGGLTVQARAAALAEVAHPQFRDELREAARRDR